MLTFEPETHTYRVSGRVVPSVTQLLDRMQDWRFLSDDLLEAARDRGSYVHKLCEIDDRTQDLHPDEERGPHWSRLLAWRKFCRDYGANWEAVEEMGYSARLDYAGTLDRRGRLEKVTPHSLWLIDIKTSASPSRVWGLQLAAYRNIIAERDPAWALCRRATVRLLADGTYRFDEFRDPRDWGAFQSLLNLLSWRDAKP